MNGLNSSDKTDREYSLAPADDLIRFWRTQVKVTAKNLVAKASTSTQGHQKLFLVGSSPPAENIQWIIGAGVFPVIQVDSTHSVKTRGGFGHVQHVWPNRSSHT